MNVRYKTVSWEFNRSLWSQVMTEWVDAFGIKEVANMLDVSTGAISGWTHMHRKPEYPWPSMMSFMRVINELDLDPSDFFILEE